MNIFIRISAVIIKGICLVIYGGLYLSGLWLYAIFRIKETTNARKILHNQETNDFSNEKIA